jgi:DNA helicase II / ATP-dependent DNA helicase PcrA
MELNPEQLIAVHHVEGPMLVLSGAGSGKTRVVTQRIAYLLSLGIPASEIVAVTFTNRAADEMRERVLRMTHKNVLTSTFHSLAARILRESITYLDYPSDFTIFDEEDSEKLLKECLASLNLKEEKGLLKTIKLEISHAKNHLQKPTDYLEVYELYQKKLKESHALDFDDLLFLTVSLFEKFPEVLQQYQKRWPFILIDEYQDTNHAQYMLIKQLGGARQNVFAVGDPDQSIYSWRGATIGNILNFEKDFPGAKLITLEQNYRSPNNILSAANQLINRNLNRYPKNLWSTLKDSEKIGFYICDNEKMEAAFVVERLLSHHQKDKIPLNECVIFYRTNFQSRIFEDALLKEQIPYVMIGGLSFYQRKEIKDLLAFLRLGLGKADWLSFVRTINLPRRGLGETTLAKLRLLAEEQGVNILTASSKILGGEFALKLSQKQAEGLREYLNIISSLKETYKKAKSLSALITETIEKTRTLEYLKEDPLTYHERRENLEELVSKAVEWEKETPTPSLISFLEELTLKSSLEKTPPQASVSLMTLHNGKGLEFDLVFLVGMEEDLFPHVNSKESLESIEEERRLCYVGMTRSKKYLYFTAARQRFLWGASRRMHPSRFLSEVPRDALRPFHLSTFEVEEERQFSSGDVVFHKDFGTGIIQKSYQTSLGLTYDVFFPNAQTERTLVAKYAKLLPA